MTIFIIGTGRCGTSMLAQMLNCHSLVCVPHEIQILFEYCHNGIGLFEVFAEKKNEYFSADDFVSLIEKKCPHNFHEYFDYRSFFENQQYPILDLKELVNKLYTQIAYAENKKIFTDQTPWYGQRIDILNGLFPDAKYIHMVRDGRDVAISFARTPWWHKDIKRNLEQWYFEVSQILDSSARILKESQMLQVRYEDIVEQPELQLRRICSFLEINFERTMLDPKTYVDYAQYSKLDYKTISSSKLNEWSKSYPTFKDSSYAWKSYEDFDFSRAPKKVNQLLQALSYEVEIPRFGNLILIYLKVKMAAKILLNYCKGIVRR